MEYPNAPRSASAAADLVEENILSIGRSQERKERGDVGSGEGRFCLSFENVKTIGNKGLA